jgi:hypothetical protein
MLLVLLIFVGQVVSAPLSSCTKNSNDNSTHSMMMNIDLNSDSAAMDMQSSDSFMQMDCCGDDCQCPVAMCVSMAYISDSEIIKVQQFSEFISFLPLKTIQLSQSNDSLYRPPIFC